MKLVTFDLDGELHWGRIVGDSIIDHTSKIYPSLKSALGSGEIANICAQDQGLPKLLLAETTLAPVIPAPDKIICIGLNYHEHREESHNPNLKYPTIFTRWADTQIGNMAAIVHPCVTDQLDYEGEMAVIIGKAGKNITRENAFDYIAGYACYNDVSVRDWQKRTTQMTPGKNFAATAPFGPYLLTVDEVEDVEALSICTRLNGNTVQSAKIGDMIFKIPELIEYCSTFTALSPGDVIVTGTPGGVGFRREPQLFMKPGDVVEVEISGLGILRNPVVAEAV